VAAFPLQLTGGSLARQEHVTCCRQTAAYVAAALAAPGGAPAGPFDYLPFFYSRVFNLSWQVRAAWRAAPPYSPRGWAVSGEGERCLEGAAA
jgi:hypothetical protein